MWKLQRKNKKILKVLLRLIFIKLQKNQIFNY